MEVGEESRRDKVWDLLPVESSREPSFLEVTSALSDHITQGPRSGSLREGAWEQQGLQEVPAPPGNTAWPEGIFERVP